MDVLRSCSTPADGRGGNSRSTHSRRGARKGCTRASVFTRAARCSRECPSARGSSGCPQCSGRTSTAMPEPAGQQRAAARWARRWARTPRRARTTPPRSHSPRGGDSGVGAHLCVAGKELRLRGLGIRVVQLHAVLAVNVPPQQPREARHRREHRTPAPATHPRTQYTRSRPDIDTEIPRLTHRYSRETTDITPVLDPKRQINFYLRLCHPTLELHSATHQQEASENSTERPAGR